MLKQRSVDKLIRDLRKRYPDSFKKATQQPGKAEICEHDLYMKETSELPRLSFTERITMSEEEVKAYDRTSKAYKRAIKAGDRETARVFKKVDAVTNDLQNVIRDAETVIEATLGGRVIMSDDTIRDVKAAIRVAKVAKENIDKLQGDENIPAEMIEETAEKLTKEAEKAIQDVTDSIGDIEALKLQEPVEVIKEVKEVIKDVTEEKLTKEKPKKVERRAVFAESLDSFEIQALEVDLTAYLNSDLKKKSEKDFLENFLANKLKIKPMQPQNAKYETWRRGDRIYNLPWIKIKRHVFTTTGLKFAR